ncbi:MAG TPA: lysophospholipid acyltransferase family protein [Candidatus Dormibacteraeota bacterium]|nr:lysophospholipid acyltransferase family protein [Candidatus Dormibacteraeota bacterium]
MRLTVPRALVPRVGLRPAREVGVARAPLVAPEPLLPYLGLRAAELVLRTVDRTTAYRLTGPLATLLTTCWPSHWRGLRANLEVISPGLSRRQMRRLLRQNVRNFFKAWIDLLQMSHRPLESWRRLIRLENAHFLDEARQGGHGVIIVSLHLGSWEAAIAALRDHFTFTEGGLALLAEQVRPIRCFNWLVRARTKVGCQVIPLNVDAVRQGDQEAVSRSGAAAVRQIYKVLSKDGVVVIAIDRDLLGTGEPLPFCGRRASIPLGAVEIAARTGAAILPVCLLREPDDTYLGRGFAPIWVPVGGNSQENFRRAARQLLRILEPELRAHPDQWHVMTPLFGEPMADLEPLVQSHSAPVAGAAFP